MSLRSGEIMSPKILSSARLQNENSHLYLLTLKRIYLSLKEDSKDQNSPKNNLKNIFDQVENDYDERKGYADLYVQLIQCLEQHAGAWLSRSNTKELRDLLIAVYDNPAPILKYTADRLREMLSSFKDGDKHLPKPSKIRDLLKDKGDYNNPNTMLPTPYAWGGVLERVKATLASSYLPQHVTLVSQREYEYNKKDGNITPKGSFPVELRLGTQGQLINNQPRVSPNFKAYLMAQKEEFPLKKYTHLYINNLALDGNSYEHQRERSLTLALHGLEYKHSNIAVVTLPADKGMFNREFYHHTKRVCSKDSAIKILTSFIVEGEKKYHLKGETPETDLLNSLLVSNKRDVKMSEAIWAEILPTDKTKMEYIQEKLNEGLVFFGWLNKKGLSLAQMEILWFHFIKFQLTRDIIKAVDPVTFNISCKDAIDRAAVASAYLNLMQSLGTVSPMTRDEFEMALHAAAAMVKGRGMNHHIEHIWHALKAYIVANPIPKTVIEKVWIYDWLNENQPASLAPWQKVYLSPPSENLAHSAPPSSSEEKVNPLFLSLPAPPSPNPCGFFNRSNDNNLTLRGENPKPLPNFQNPQEP